MIDKNSVEVFEKTQSQIAKLHQEVSILSKSKPDNPINKFKLTLINQRLEAANAFLTGEHKPFADFELFDESSLPSNSDVVFILSQYLDAFEGWRSANVIYRDYQWKWNIKNGETIYSYPPTRNKSNPN
jgi:hypothetical protein